MHIAEYAEWICSYTEKTRKKFVHILRTHGNARQVEYLGKLEIKIIIFLDVHQEPRWVLLAKPIKTQKSHTSVPLTELNSFTATTDISHQGHQPSGAQHINAITTKDRHGHLCMNANKHTTAIRPASTSPHSIVDADSSDTDWGRIRNLSHKSDQRD